MLRLLAGSEAVAAADTRQLYLVTGVVSSNFFNWNAASELLALNAGASAIVHVQHLANGSWSIIADHDRRLIVIDGIVLRMDSAKRPQVVPGTNVKGTAICTLRGARETLCSVGVYTQGRLQGVDLGTRGSAESHLLPRDEPWLVRTDGFWSPVDLPNEGIFLLAKNGKLRFGGNVGAAELPIPFPAGLEPSDNLYDVRLDISNDSTVVIDRYGRPKAPGDAETHTFFIFDKKAASWSNVRFDDSAESVRGFGPWIATEKFVRRRAIGAQSDPKNEPASPGTEFRQKILNPEVREREHVPLDDFFQLVPWYFPGELCLYNIRSRQKYTIQTGQGDSEILLVDDDKVYYRVNDALYMATIGRTAIERAVKIVSDESVQLAHWAFLGPPVSKQ
jgi:hypothetical protein